LKRLVAALGHPERSYRVVHVAGTNGKGLTCAMVARLLQQAGYRCGLYTSPHVVDIRERIAIDGAPITEAAFARAGHAVLDEADRLEREMYVSYFDVLTAVGLLAFQHAGVAWAVLETGMGGLSDATNITDKALAVITRIGWDHVGILGNTLPEIAAQKVGIARPGVPTVVGAQPEELQRWVMDAVAERGSPVVDAREYRVEAVAQQPPRVRVHWSGAAPMTLEAPRPLTPPLLQCAANALAAAHTLLGEPDEATCRAWATTALGTRLPGRLERHADVALRGHDGAPFAAVVLDGGHNPEALEALVTQLEAWDARGCALIFAMQADKFITQARSALERLFARAARIHTVSLHTPRSPTAAEIAQRVREIAAAAGYDVPVTPYDDAREALVAAAANPERPLVVCGSFWLLGDVLPHLSPAADGNAQGEEPNVR